MKPTKRVGFIPRCMFGFLPLLLPFYSKNEVLLKKPIQVFGTFLLPDMSVQENPLLEGVLREVKEEIGLDILEKDLIPLDIRKNTNRFDNGIIDCEFQHVFLVKLETTVSQLTIQATEVDAVRLFTFDELQLCWLQNHPTYTIVPADMSILPVCDGCGIESPINSSKFARCKTSLPSKSSL